jgi:hypothetical protein
VCKVLRRCPVTVKYLRFISNFNKKRIILGLVAVTPVIILSKTYRERLKNRIVI